MHANLYYLHMHIFWRSVALFVVVIPAKSATDSQRDKNN